jgi:hypothetical protein
MVKGSAAWSQCDVAGVSIGHKSWLLLGSFDFCASIVLCINKECDGDDNRLDSVSWQLLYSPQATARFPIEP